MSNSNKPQDKTKRKKQLEISSAKGRQRCLKKKIPINDRKQESYWEMSVDLPEYEIFIHDLDTMKPNIIMCKEKKVIDLIGLTVLHEDNMGTIRIRTIIHHQHLLEEYEEAELKAEQYPIDLGNRCIIGSDGCWHNAYLIVKRIFITNDTHITMKNVTELG